MESILACSTKASSVTPLFVFIIVALVQHVANFSRPVLRMRFYDALFFLSSCFFTLQTLYFSLSPPPLPTLSCMAQSLLVPGKTPSKYGRRGSAIGIGTIEEVDIYPFHIANVIVFPLVFT